MKIKYRNNILKPNQSICCIDCDICDFYNPNKTCFRLCYKTRVKSGFIKINCYEVLEL